MYTSLELEEFWITLGNGINRFNICFYFVSQKNTVITGLRWNAVVSG